MAAQRSSAICRAGSLARSNSLSTLRIWSCLSPRQMSGACAATTAVASAVVAINPNVGLVVRGPSPAGLRSVDVARDRRTAAPGGHAAATQSRGNAGAWRSSDRQTLAALDRRTTSALGVGGASFGGTPHERVVDRPGPRAARGRVGATAAQCCRRRDPRRVGRSARRYGGTEQSADAADGAHGRRHPRAAAPWGRHYGCLGHRAGRCMGR